jgi:hypothetical protein
MKFLILAKKNLISSDQLQLPIETVMVRFRISKCDYTTYQQNEQDRPHRKPGGEHRWLRLVMSSPLGLP